MIADLIDSICFIKLHEKEQIHWINLKLSESINIQNAERWTIKACTHPGSGPNAGVVNCLFNLINTLM